MQQENQVLRQSGLKHLPRMPLAAYNNSPVGAAGGGNHHARLPGGSPAENGMPYASSPATPDVRGGGYSPGMGLTVGMGGSPLGGVDTPVTPTEADTRRQKMLNDRQKVRGGRGEEGGWDDADGRGGESGKYGWDNRTISLQREKNKNSFFQQPSHQCVLTSSAFVHPSFASVAAR